MQDERDSGSDGEDDVNEQHSGSDTGSVERHSEVLATRHLRGTCPLHSVRPVLLRSYRDLGSGFIPHTLGVKHFKLRIALKISK